MSDHTPLTVGILVSGRGSNMLSILRSIDRHELNIRVGVVVSNKTDAPALDHATRYNVPTAIVDHRETPKDREAFEKRVDAVLRDHGVELVALAGFMRILSPFFVRQWPHKVINIHPSLLPAFPGLHAQRQALDTGVKLSGCTVHFVDEGTDTGAIIGQVAVQVADHDTEETLSARILAQEHLLYPKVLGWFADKRVRVHDQRVTVEPANG